MFLENITKKNRGINVSLAGLKLCSSFGKVINLVHFFECLRTTKHSCSLGNDGLSACFLCCVLHVVYCADAVFGDRIDQ